MGDSTRRVVFNLQTFLDEFNKAGERIQRERGKFGGAKAASMGWLLAFTQQDLGALSQADRDNLSIEVFRFCQDAGSGSGLIAGTPLFEKVELLQFQAQARRTLDAYLKIQPVPSSSLSFKTPVSLSLSGGPRPRLSVHAEHLTAAFDYQVAYLLAEFGPRIRRCHGCPRLFLAGRTDRKWCAGRCQASNYKLAHPPKRRKPSRKRVTRKVKKGGRHAKRKN